METRLVCGQDPLNYVNELKHKSRASESTFYDKRIIHISQDRLKYVVLKEWLIGKRNKIYVQLSLMKVTSLAHYGDINETMGRDKRRMLVSRSAGFLKVQETFA